MSKLIEILRTLRSNEQVKFSGLIQIDGLMVTGCKISADHGAHELSRIVTHSLMNLSIIEEPEAIELQDMLTKLREHAKGKADAYNANS